MVTQLLQHGYTTIPRRLPDGYEMVTERLHNCYNFFTFVLQNGHTLAPILPEMIVKTVIQLFQHCFKIGF